MPRARDFGDPGSTSHYRLSGCCLPLTDGVGVAIISDVGAEPSRLPCCARFAPAGRSTRGNIPAMTFAAAVPIGALDFRSFSQWRMRRCKIPAQGRRVCQCAYSVLRSMATFSAVCQRKYLIHVRPELRKALISNTRSEVNLELPLVFAAQLGQQAPHRSAAS